MATKPVPSAAKKKAQPAKIPDKTAPVLPGISGDPGELEAKKQPARQIVAKREQETLPSEPLRPDAETTRRALQDLGINVPYYQARVVGNRLEITLYWGAVVSWSPEAPAPNPNKGRPNP